MSLGDAEAVALLTDLLRTPSLAGEEGAVAALLLDTLRGTGFAGRCDEVGNVVGSIGPESGPSVVLLGHMDTVPGAVPVEQRDGALYGRGAVDAKGPLATAIVAASRAAASTRAHLTVIGAVQEEGPSLGARHLTRLPAPEFLIIAEPSGWDSIVLGYKGSQRFTVEIEQPCGHTAGPESSAPERAVAFWTDLVAWCAERNGSGDGFDALTPALLGMASRSDGLHETATLHIGLRLPPGLAPEEARTGVQSLFPDARFTFAAGEAAVRGPKSGPLVAGFLRAIRAEGGSPRFKVKTGTSDMNVVGPAWGCPMLAYGPGDSRLDHRPDEHLSIDEYLRAIRVLTRVLGELG